MSMNDFIVLQKLGSGSFASVYKARRLVDQKIYALKKIDLKGMGLRQKNNALNQIRLLACLKSPFIIGYCDSFFDQKLDILFIAMQYADGGDLYRKIQKHKKQNTLIPEIEIWKILLHLLYGLNELHSRSILHRDLKSQNVFIADQTYKIGDMNVSKIVKNGRLAHTQTGTPYYASPEVWNDQPYNEKSDIWSLGCILYEITALRPPFEAKSMQKLFEQINHAPIPKIPKNYSKQLQSIIDKCLQNNPNMRPFTRDLLSHQTVKLYENMLIEYKPTVQNKKQNLLLKTIYMPASKRDLNNKLPQSNYKSDRIQSNSKELSQELKSKEIKKIDCKLQQKIEDIRHVQTKSEVQKSSEIKNPLSQIQPILSNIENLISKNQSDQKGKNKKASRSKDKSNNKKSQSSTSNRKRANSCKIFKEKQNKNTSSRKDILARAQIIIDSQKFTKAKPPSINFSTEKKKTIQQTNEKSLITIIEEVVENDLFREKIEEMKQKSLQPRKLIFEDILKIQTQQQQISKKTQKEASKIGDSQKCQKSQNQKKIKEATLSNISKNSYLGDTIKNLSNISEKNHEYYNFQLQNTDNKKDQKDLYQIPANILIDEIKNYQNIQICQKLTHPLKQSKKVDLIVGFQKLRGFFSKQVLKINLSFFNKLKNEVILDRFKFKKENLIRKIQQQDMQFASQKLFYQQVKAASPYKTEQKRARSRSIPKLEKPKRNISENQQLNNFLLNKIVQQELPLKISENKYKSKDQYKENHFIQKNINNENVLIYKFVSSGKKSPQQNNILRQQVFYKYQTDQKQKYVPLMDKKLSNILISHQKSHKKIFPNSIFSQGSTQFDIKKRKIFEDVQTSNYLVHNLNNQLDRMNLERKIKKYINI